ncbi:hypothetical protein J437_LFUL018132 [Ladona fulva]|uniref:Uncharacterized protein n=1 Tax=Ladona fulva TaxID=123851 RepID=A0A8K0KME5_LADFU|nr:hypothetical protein J437_LFUL018132 [Ladona fulva]
MDQSADSKAPLKLAASAKASRTVSLSLSNCLRNIPISPLMSSILASNLVLLSLSVRSKLARMASKISGNSSVGTRAFRAVRLGGEDTQLQNNVFATSGWSVTIPVSAHPCLVPVSRNVMESSHKQHHVIKFCSKLNQSLAEARWRQCSIIFATCTLKEFKEGQEEVVNEPHAGQPATSTTDNNLACVRDLLNSDHWLSVWMIAETLNIPKTIAHELVTNKLGMRKVCGKLLTDNQKNYQVTVATELLKHPYSPDMAPANFFLFRGSRPS